MGLFTNGNGNYFVAKWDGSKWSELGGINSSKFNKEVYTIKTDAFGNLYAAGNFTNSVGKYYVAKYNGNSWIELGTNDTFTTSSITPICSDASGNIYGVVKNILGDNYVAKWDGTKWNELGGKNALSANGDILTICSDKSK